MKKLHPLYCVLATIALITTANNVVLYCAWSATATAPAPMTAPVQIVIEVPDGANLVPLLTSAKPHTTFNCRHNVTSDAQMILTAAKTSIYIDGCDTGSLKCEPSPGTAAIFSAIGCTDFRLQHFASITGTVDAILVDDEGTGAIGLS